MRNTVLETPLESVADDSFEADVLRIGEVAAELDSERITSDALALAERIVQRRFYVACIGQFKRGKSTLLNALVGQSILPAAIVPVTAVPTVLRFGRVLDVRVRFRSKPSLQISVPEIENYVSEERNPLNAKDVQLVEVFVPSVLLEHGMCLVDTPGIGSVFANNTATTHAFIPHIDAALAVIGADPPISGDELSLIEQVARSTPHILLALNKADRFTARECEEAVAFTGEMIRRRLGREAGPIYAVSAMERLARSDASVGEDRDWSALIEALERLASDGGRQIVRESAVRGITRLALACQRAIVDATRALHEPFEVSDRRLNQLQSYVTRVGFELPRLDGMMRIERERILERLSTRRDEFLAATVPAAKLELAERMPMVTAGGARSFRDAAFALARHIADERLKRWFCSEERLAEDLFGDATRGFAEMAHAFLVELKDDSVSSAAIDRDALSIDQNAFDTDRGFTQATGFYFHDVESLLRTASPWSGAVDMIRRRSVVRRAAIARGAWYVEQLLEINSTRVRNDLDERMLESGRQLVAEIRIILQDLLRSAERSLVRARAAHADGEASVTLAVERLAGLEAEVAAIQIRHRSTTAR